MSTTESKIFSNEDLEDYMDVVKCSILKALYNEGYIEKEEADKWCENHTVLVRKKGFFQTISDKFKKEKEKPNTDVFIVVERK